MPSKKNIIDTLLDGDDAPAGPAKPSIPKKLTILPLRDVVIFPSMIFPVLIGRASSLKAVADAVERDKFIFVSAQKEASTEDPKIKDVYNYGTIAKILQIMRLPNNLLKVLVEGIVPGRIVRAVRNAECLEATIEPIEINYNQDDPQFHAILRRASDLFGDYVKANKNTPPEVKAAFDNIDDPARKLHYAAANIQEKVSIKQTLLESTDLSKLYFGLVSMLTQELELQKIEEELDTKVHDAIQKNQKKYFIQEQIRALQKELDDEEEATPELAAIKAAIENAGMPELAKAKAIEEFDKLKKTPTVSPEYGVLRTYLETMTALPWSNSSTDNLKVEHAEQVLNDDHYDLEKPKERILEYISVLNLVGSVRGQILCFVGPPGVGKTSLAKSIARALGRQFVRISLGGIRDEAEIRGHRRTYIGALPGKILGAMKKAGTINPVILLDEIDKLSSDFRGDPSAALLEVLDPEQNSTFNDHYLEVDYDLSKVLFITTANVKYDINAPLLDRMEVIELSSYLDFDKLQIAKRHILPKLIENLGLSKFFIEFSDPAILRVIREYTRESGVRNLERELSSILRKVAKEIVEQTERKPSTGKSKKASAEHNHDIRFSIEESDVERYLKVPRFRMKTDELLDKVGVATGLAWTSMGGDTLPVEVSIMPGSEKLTLTGKLGDVMKESATAALSYVRSAWSDVGVSEDFAKGKEIHIHVPEGAIPKDGPSAGITMTVALVSAASGLAIRGDVAMTGEVTLRGNILAIGGLNEKLLAAKRHGIRTVLIPKENEKDISEIKADVKEGMTIVPISHVREALEIVLRQQKPGMEQPVVVLNQTVAPSTVQ